MTKTADASCDAHEDRPMGRNEALVLDVLTGTDQPLSAYAILDSLRGEGLKAPAQVYRALDRLVEDGQAHRLESLNAFIACNHTHCQRDERAAFAICETCGKVTEFSDPAVEGALAVWAGQAGFSPTRTTIELRGLCPECQNGQV